MSTTQTHITDEQLSLIPGRAGKARPRAHIRDLALAVAVSEARTAFARRQMDKAIGALAERIADGLEYEHWPNGTTTRHWAAAAQRWIDRVTNTWECEAWFLAKDKAALADALAA
jgi:hypothetical protein